MSSGPPVLEQVPATDPARLAAEIATIGSRKVGCELVARVLDRGPLLPDARVTLLLAAADETPRAVAQHATALAPDMVTRAVDRARAFRDALAPADAAAVLEPVADGMLAGVSFAIWPWCRPLSNTTGSWMERRALARPTLTWLANVLARTVRPAPRDEIGARFDAPLRRMAGNSALSPRMQQTACNALARLDAGDWQPMLVAMHGDMHTGNVLVDDGNLTSRSHLPWAQRFVVIDWSGSRLDGHPIYDLVRMAHSLRIDPRRLATQVVQHCETIRCPLEDARCHLAAAFADLGANLEHFPVELYAQLADLSFSLLDAALSAAGVRES